MKERGKRPMAEKMARAYEGAENYIPVPEDCSDEEMNLEV